MSFDDLKDNALYIILFVRPSLEPNDFHWSLYHHTNETVGGCKYHIKGSPGTWLTDHGVTRGVWKSFLLIGLLHIADVPNKMEDRTKALITQEDNNLNTIPGNTCRTWVLRALERLKDTGILRCSDVLALEQEVLEFGNSELEATAQCVQPRVVIKSKLCGLA